MEDGIIKKLQKKLKNYFTYQKTSDILIVSLDKHEMPFAYVVYDNVHYPNNLLLSFSVDFPIASMAANLALDINDIKPVIISEQFFISNSGITYWAEEAEKMFEIENLLNIEDLEPESQEVH